MNTIPEQASYLTGDENLVNLSVSVHYRLTDPVAFLYGMDRGRPIVKLYAQTATREVVASSGLDALLTEQRQPLETEVGLRLQTYLDRLGAGVEVTSVNVVDIHPPQEAVFAFRDVSSAREDRETLVHKARQVLALQVPRARGEAAKALAAAEAKASSAQTIAGGQARAFSATAEAFALETDVLRHLLGLEAVERALSGKDKLIIPSGAPGPHLALWQEMPAPNRPSEDE
jgi:membrane protease subunit HflK